MACYLGIYIWGGTIAGVGGGCAPPMRSVKKKNYCQHARGACVMVCELFLCSYVDHDLAIEIELGDL